MRTVEEVERGLKALDELYATYWELAISLTLIDPTGAKISEQMCLICLGQIRSLQWVLGLTEIYSVVPEKPKYKKDGKTT